MGCIVSLEIFLSGASPPRLPSRPAAHAPRSSLGAARTRQTTLSPSLSLSLPFHGCRNATATAISLHFLLEAALHPSLAPWRTRSLPRRFTSVPPPSLFADGASSLPRLVVYVMRASLDQGHPKSSTAHAIITSSSVPRVRLTSSVWAGKKEGGRVSLA